MDKQNSRIMRVDASFVAYTKEIQMRIMEREKSIPSMTEVTKRIANESVHPYQHLGKALGKIGQWK